MTTRRGFLLGLGAALAAPAIVKAENIMKVAQLRQPRPTIWVQGEADYVIGRVLSVDNGAGTAMVEIGYAERVARYATVARQLLFPGEFVGLTRDGKVDWVAPVPAAFEWPA